MVSRKPGPCQYANASSQEAYRRRVQDQECTSCYKHGAYRRIQDYAPQRQPGAPPMDGISRLEMLQTCGVAAFAAARTETPLDGRLHQIMSSFQARVGAGIR